MFLSDVSVRRPVLATVLSSLIVAFGVLSFGSLPLRELPDVDPPIVSISTTYPGASSAVVESRITKPLEDRLNGIDGIRTIEATSSDGASYITIEFELSRDIADAANDVRERIARAIDDLPETAQLGALNKAVTGLVKGNKYDRQHALEILGYCDVLRSPEHEPLRGRYLNQLMRPQPAQFTKRDWHFPLNFWTGEYGIDREGLAFWFPEFADF